MIPQTAALLYEVIERASQPRWCLITKRQCSCTEGCNKMKKQGIPIGTFQAVADATGKTKIKPKRKAQGAATEIAKRKKRKWRPAK